MEFRFDEDQLAVRDAVRAFCADRFDVGEIAGREGKSTDGTSWSMLARLGILGMLLDDPGSGTGIVEASLVFEELGAHLVTGPVLWSTLAAPFVEGAAEGVVRVAGVEVDGATDGPIVVEHADECDAVLVLQHDRVHVCARSQLPPPAEASPLDPLTPVAVFPSVPAGDVVGAEDAACRTRRSGEILSAAMLVGVAQAALDVARAYALEREQFGVPIGSFQAIKHLLADMYVRVELARDATYAAAAIAADPRAGDPDRAAASAKVLAGEAGIANAHTAVQVLGGMGFTWDMLAHYYLKRAWVLEHSFGTASAHAARLGAAVGEEVGSP